MKKGVRFLFCVTLAWALAAAAARAQALPPQQQKRQFEVSANDKRFLRSLRIAADETQEKEVE